MSQLKKLVQEIHRRSLWQVLLLYAAAAWAVLAAVDTLAGALGLPEWAPPFALFLLIVGLPIVLATAFVQEGMGTREKAASTESETTEGAGTAVESPIPAAGDSGVRHRLFTWRKAILGGAVAFTLFGVGTAGYMASRLLGIGPWATLTATGALSERPEVLVTDFDSADDPGWATAISEGIRADLGQSPAILVTSRGAAAQTLERMGESTEARLDDDLAREVAVRLGAEGVLRGTLHRLGGGYQLLADLVSAESGEVLASFRETAADSTQLLPAADELSASIRARIGENLATIRRSLPLPAVTTPSLEALRRYAMANELADAEGEYEEALEHLEAAVALDSGFAEAHRKTWVALTALNRSPSQALEALRTALRHRDRLSAGNLAQAVGLHHVAYNRGDSALAAFRDYNLAHPERPFLNNHAALLAELERYDDAITVWEECFPTRCAWGWDLVYNNLTETLYMAGRHGEWTERIREWEARLPESRRRPLQLARVSAAEGRWAEAEQRLEEYQGFGDGPEAWARRAYVAAARGRVGEAASLLSSALQEHMTANRAQEAIELAVDRGLLHLVTGDTTEALAVVDSVLEVTGFPDALDPLDRPFEVLAFFRIEAGEPDLAASLLEDARRRNEASGIELPRTWFLLMARVAAANRALANAQDLLVQATETQPCCVTRGWLPHRAAMELVQGAVHETARAQDSVVVAYQRFLEPRRLRGRLALDAFFRAAVLERLGQLYDERGDFENAAKYYDQFIKLWADADEQLQPRVRAAQRRRGEIVSERG